MTSIAEMEGMLKSITLREQESAKAFDETRTALQSSMRDAGFSEGEIADTLEAYERAAVPHFGQASAGRFASRPLSAQGGTPPVGPEQIGVIDLEARRSYDTALRRRVGGEVFDRYTAALKNFRETGAISQRFKDRAFDAMGSERFTRAVNEAANLTALRDDVDEIFRSVNPDYSLEAVYPMFAMSEQTVENTDSTRGNEQGGAEAEANGFDPLRRVVTIALDPVHARQDAYRTAFQTITHLLNEEEREVLLVALRVEHPGLTDGALMSKAADAFARDAVPTGRRRPPAPLRRALKPIRAFFRRIANKAAGRGFQTPEDVWKRVQSGAIASRNDQVVGEKVPASYVDQKAHDAFKTSLASLSGTELAARLEAQHQAISDAQMTRKNRKLLARRSPARRQANRTLQTELRALLRARTLMEAEATRRANTVTLEQLKDGGLAPSPGDGPGNGPGTPTPDESQDGPERDALASGNRSAEVIDLSLRQRGFDPQFVANDNGSVNVQGQRQRFVVSPQRTSTDPEHANSYFTVDSRPAGKTPVRLGMFQQASDAAMFLDTLDKAKPRDGAHMCRDTTELLKVVQHHAQEQPGQSADIQAIRTSGLLDAALDEAIGERNAYAFVYPLKNGDIIWEGPDGWQAGSVRSFEQAVFSSQDTDAQEAVEVVRNARGMDDGRNARGMDDGRNARGLDDGRNARGMDEGQKDDRLHIPDTETSHSVSSVRSVEPHPDHVPTRSGRIPLQVPTDEEMDAVSKGALFDEDRGIFYAPNETTAARLQRWTAPIVKESLPTAEIRLATLQTAYRKYETPRLLEVVDDVSSRLKGKNLGEETRASLSVEHLALATVLKERGIKTATTSALGTASKGEREQGQARSSQTSTKRDQKKRRGMEM